MRPALLRASDLWYNKSMLYASINELKKDFSRYLSDAERGIRIIITKRNKPVAALSTVTHSALHVGSRFGSANLSAFLSKATDGKYLEVLDDDCNSDKY